MKKPLQLMRFLSVIAVFMAGLSISAQKSLYIDFEDGTPEASEWMVDGADLASITIEDYAGARSGSKVLKITDYNRNTGFHIYTLAQKIVVQPGEYIHAIAYAGVTNADGAEASGAQIKASYYSTLNKPTPGMASFSTTDVTTEGFDGTIRSNTSAVALDVSPRTRFKPGAIDNIVYYDDFILYADANETFDFDAPEPATDLLVDGSTNLSWTAGSDVKSGVDKILVFRTEVVTPDALTLKNQSGYRVGNVVGDWTLVAIQEGTSTSYIDATGGNGVTHAVVVKDLAYNYSTPLISSVPTDIINSSVAKFKCVGTNGSIEMNSLPVGEYLAVYNLSGALVYSQAIESERITIPLSVGMYIVRINESVKKVVVR